MHDTCSTHHWIPVLRQPFAGAHKSKSKDPHPQIWGGVPSELKYKNNGVGLHQKNSAGGLHQKKVRAQKWGPWPGMAHMGQGPYGPRDPGPRVLPCWANTSPKNAPWKKRVQIRFFFCFWETKKMRDVRTIILAAVSRRDLCYVSENEGFRFAKHK